MSSYQEHQQYGGKYLFIPEIPNNSYNTLDNYHQAISLRQKDQSSAPPASLPLTQKNTKPTKKSTVQISKSQTGGHHAGSKNFTEEDSFALVQLMEDHKPIGPHSWLAVEKGYNEWARINNSIEHDQTSLQRKWNA